MSTIINTLVKKNVSIATSSINRSSKRMLSVIPPAIVDSFYEKNKENIIPVDASWYMPNVPITAFHEFMKNRFVGAVFLDIDEVKDSTSQFPHMLPSKEEFETIVSKLGIKNDSVLLFYDQQGVFSLCRAVWMFEIFGHDLSKLNILNTYPAYKKSHSDPNLVMKVHGKETLVDNNLFTKETPYPPSNYKATMNEKKVVTYEQLLELVKSDKIGSEYNLIDARSGPRFTGEAPEPRPGLSSGHIKNAINIPFSEVLTPDKAFLSAMTLKSIFKEKKIDDSKPIIVMCGTGVTACLVRCALQLAGYNSENIAVYDGSWTEWAQRAPAELIVKDF